MLLKVAGGLAQVLAAWWLASRRDRAPALRPLAWFLALDGIGYAVRNLASFDDPLSPTLLDAQSVLQALSIPGAILFGLRFAPDDARDRPTVATAALAGGAWFAAQSPAALAVSPLRLASSASYAAVVFALVLLAARFPRATAQRRAMLLLSAALLVNLGLHVGPAMLTLSEGRDALLATGLYFGLAVAWLANTGGHRPAGARNVALFALGLLLVGMVLQVALGSYRAYQDAGIVGAGRILASGLVVAAAEARRTDGEW